MALQRYMAQRQLGQFWRAKAVTERPRPIVYLTALLFGSFLFPIEVAVRLGIVFTARRIALLICLAFLVPILKNKIESKTFVPVLSDFFIVGLALWCPIAMAHSNGLASIVSQEAFQGFELLVPYLVARVLVSNIKSLRLSVNIFLLILIVLLGLGALDLIAGENILARLATNVFGNFRSVKFYGAGDAVLSYTTQYRFGLPRVRGPIEHAIIYGAIFATLLPVLYYVIKDVKLRLLAFGICGMGVVFALSSAPILGYIAVVGLISWDTLMENFRSRWILLLLFAFVALIAIFGLVDNPLKSFITFGTLDPATGFTRLEIWTWVAKNLKVSPLMGIGKQDWFRPDNLLDSIDILWLNFALKFGYVGLTLLLGCIVGPYFILTPRQLPVYPAAELAEPRKGFVLASIVIAFVACTIDLWGSIWSIWGFVLGAQAALTEASYLPPQRRLAS